MGMFSFRAAKPEPILEANPFEPGSPDWHSWEYAQQRRCLHQVAQSVGSVVLWLKVAIAVVIVLLVGGDEGQGLLDLILKLL